MTGLRITLVTGEYPPRPGGVGDYSRCLGEILAGRGHEVAALTIAGGGLLVHRPGSAQAPVMLRPVLRRNLWGWRCWGDIIAACTLLRPQLLHIQYQTGAYNMHPAINLLPWRLRGLPGAPRTLVTFHDLLEPYLFPKAGPLRRRVTLRLAGDADAVVATNPADAERLAEVAALLQQIPIGSNIPPAPPPDYCRQSWRAGLGAGDDSFLIGYFGLLSRNKGVDLLLDVLRHSPPNWRLLIIGGGATAPQDRAYATEIAALIEQWGLYERVKITGQVEASSVSAHLLASDCIALPFRDGASLRSGSLLAALSHGCALVTTSVGAEVAVLQDEQEGLLVQAGDVAGLAQALHRLADDPLLRKRLGASARVRAAPFSWEAIATAHEQLYRRVLERPEVRRLPLH